MEVIVDKTTQESNEYAYCKKHIDVWIREVIEEDSAVQEKVTQGVELLNEYITGDYYDSKQARVDQLVDLDLEELVEKIFVQIAQYTNKITLVTAVSQIAGCLGFTHKVEGAQTMGEILAVLCETDVFDITKASRQASLMIQSNLRLPERLQEAIDRGMYPIPMVVPPKPVHRASQSPYLTFDESQVLNVNSPVGNHSLDVINIQNSIPLKCDVEFLTSVEETNVKGFESAEQKENWERFRKQSYAVYKLLIQQGNRFYLTNKIDRRGRTYAQGYHVNTQGVAFKKAMIELAVEEVVDGVPEKYRNP